MNGMNAKSTRSISGQLDTIRQILLVQKSRILNKSVEFRSQEMSDLGASADEADKISCEMSLSLSLHLQERDRTALLQIEKALSKIHDGTYGQCECCGDRIGLRRLTARPFASLCIECMEEQEEMNSPIN
jgi:DnaK suppressor protein